MRQEEEALLHEWAAIPFTIPGRDIFIVQSSPNDEERAAIYGFIDRRGDRYILGFPNCSTTKDIARTAGAVVSDHLAVEASTLRELPLPKSLGKVRSSQTIEGSNAECRFSTRDSFETAARRYIKERQLTGLKIERIGD